MMCIAFLCSAEDWSLAANIGSGGLHTSFHRKANEHVQVGVEFEASLRTMDSVTSLVYQMDVPKMNLLFKGCYIVSCSPD